MGGGVALGLRLRMPIHFFKLKHVQDDVVVREHADVSLTDVHDPLGKKFRQDGALTLLQLLVVALGVSDARCNANTDSRWFRILKRLRLNAQQVRMGLPGLRPIALRFGKLPPPPPLSPSPLPPVLLPVPPPPPLLPPQVPVPRLPRFLLRPTQRRRVGGQ